MALGCWHIYKTYPKSWAIRKCAQTSFLPNPDITNITILAMVTDLGTWQTQQPV